jgi:hypothetical protein
MGRRLRALLWLCATGLVLALPAAGQAISPSYDVPAAASPLHFELVPEFRQTISASQCSARGGLPSTHGSPLVLGSCNPPALLPGTQARVGPQSTSAFDITVFPGDTDPTNGDQADVGMSGVVTDVQNASPPGGDYNPNAIAADTTLHIRWRQSDSDATTAAQLCSATTSCPSTVEDTEMVVPIACVGTVDPTAGSTCSISTTFDGLVPDIIKEDKATVVQVYRARLNDAGPNGTVNDSDDKRLESQGIYIP